MELHKNTLEPCKALPCERDLEFGKLLGVLLSLARLFGKVRGLCFLIPRELPEILLYSA
jgi:hypothetical protein